jgi:hypothetical protein
MWPVPPERQEPLGKRCDIWYHVCNRPGELGQIADHAAFPKIKFVRSMPHVGNFKLARCLREIGRGHQFLDTLEYENKYLILYRACKLHSVPRADFHHTFSMRYLDRFEARLDHFVNTGFFAICELLDCGVAELYITGITFNCEDDIQDYPSYSGMPDGIRFREGSDSYHNTDGLFEIFKRMRVEDKRIWVDDTLDAILQMEPHARVEHYDPSQPQMRKPAS